MGSESVLKIVVGCVTWKCLVHNFTLNEYGFNFIFFFVRIGVKDGDTLCFAEVFGTQLFIKWVQI